VAFAADPDGSLAAQVFKTVADPYAGRLSIFRIYAGVMTADSTVTNATRAVPERFGQLFLLEGKGQKAVPSLGPGAFGAVAKLKETVTGDTLTAEGKPVLLQAIPSSRPMVTFALEPKKQGEEDKVFSSFSKLIEEDPSLSLSRNAETKEILLSGVGSVHIEATAEKLKRKFGVEVNLKSPKVPYRETIKGTVKVQGKHKRQSGGRGQYGDTWLELEPLPKGSGFEFVDRIVGGAIPKQYIPSVEKGIAEAKNTGVLAGFPVVDFRVSLYDGSFHDVDSSDMAFKIAGSKGFKKGCEQANPTLLEPIMKMVVTVPEENMGDIIGDLNGRRGRVLGVEADGRQQVVTAHVPMTEVLLYAPDLISKTGGRGTYEMEFDHYEEVPPHQAEKIVALGAVGFGEMTAEHFSLHSRHPYETAPPDHPLFLILADIAARHDVPIDLHMEAIPHDMPLPDIDRVKSGNNPSSLKANIPALERLLSYNPKVRIIWAHAGWDNTGHRTLRLMDELLSRYPNLYMTIKFGGDSVEENRPFAPGRRLKQGWLEAMKKRPDRFMMGTDQFFTPPLSDIRRKAGRGDPVKAFFSQLPPDLAYKIGFVNPIRVFGLKDVLKNR